MTVKALGWWTGFGDRVEEWLEKRTLLFLVLYSGVFLTVACFYGSKKLFWFDELLTYHLASLSHVADIWDALSDGAEVNPPGYFVLAHASQAIIGDGHLAIRLPAIFSYWLFSLCVFQFTRRGSGVLLGASAMILPSLTVVNYYSTEARSYAVVLLCSAASLLFWRMATEGKYRGVGLFGLTLTLATAVIFHYYGVFLIFVIAVGELTRSVWKIKRVDYFVWISLGAASLSLLAMLPLIEAARAFSEEFWSPPRSWSFLAQTYGSLLDGMIPVLLVTAVLVAPHLFVFPIPKASKSSRSMVVTVHELVAVSAMIALPIVVFLFARAVTNAFLDRYVLVSVVGVSVLLAWMGGTLGRSRSTVGATALVVILCSFGLSEVRLLRAAIAEPVVDVERIDFDALSSRPNLPIVFSDYVQFFPAAHYASSGKSARFYVLLKTQFYPMALAREIVRLGRMSSSNVSEFAPFVSRHRRFLVYGPPTRIFDALKDRGAVFELKAHEGPVYEVSMEPKSEGAP